MDFTVDGAIITDYKATEVKDNKEANKRTKDNLQMDIYALSFVKTHEVPLFEIRLHFLESDTVGHAQKGKGELDRAAEKIKVTEEGIQNQYFPAKPDWHNCNYCDFKAICPDSYAY